jgi:hypothetical protein
MVQEAAQKTLSSLSLKPMQSGFAGLTGVLPRAKLQTKNCRRQFLVGNRQQATGNRQQATGNRQLYTSSK